MVQNLSWKGVRFYRAVSWPGHLVSVFFHRGRVAPVSKNIQLFPHYKNVQDKTTKLKQNFTVELGWVGCFDWDRSTCWLLLSHMVPREIKAAKSRKGPILGSSRYIESPPTTPRIRCLIFLKGICCAVLDQIGSVSSGTSLGVLSVCKENKVLHNEKNIHHKLCDQLFNSKD